MHTASAADAVSMRIGLRYCCDLCQEAENGMITFMQTKTGFRELYGSFRKLADQFSALDNSLIALKLLNESPKHKKYAHMAKSLPAAFPPPLIDQPCTPVTQPMMSFTNPMVRSMVSHKLSDVSAVVSLPNPQTLEIPKARSSSGLPDMNV